VSRRVLAHTLTALLVVQMLVLAPSSWVSTVAAASSLGSPTRPRGSTVEFKQEADPFELVRAPQNSVPVIVRYVGFTVGSAVPFKADFADKDKSFGVKNPMTVDLGWDDGTSLGSFTCTIDWSDRSNVRQLVSASFKVPGHAWPGDHRVTAKARESGESLSAIVTVDAPKDDDSIRQLSDQLAVGDMLLTHGGYPAWTQDQFTSYVDRVIKGHLPGNGPDQEAEGLLGRYMAQWAEDFVFMQYWAHSAMVCAPESGDSGLQVVEMLGDGIKKTPAQQWMKDRKDTKALDGSPDPEEFELIRLADSSASGQVKANASRVAEGYLNPRTPYDYGILAAVAAHTDENGIRLRPFLKTEINKIAGSKNDGASIEYSLRDANRQYCSELIWRAYKSQGVSLKDVDPAADKWSFVLPGELAMMRGLTYVRNGTPGGTLGGPAQSATSIVMDVSGSMGDPWHDGIKIDSAKKAAADLVGIIEGQAQNAGTAEQVNVASFSTDANLLSPLTADYSVVRSAISQLTPTMATNIGGGIKAGFDDLQNAPSGAQRFMVLLSDGQNNTGMTNDEVLSGPVQDAANAGVKIYTIGFGDSGDIDESFLQQIADETGGHYYPAQDAMQLANIYIKIGVSTHAANILAEFSGTVGQGQSAEAGSFEVTSGAGQIESVLNWPGSILDLRLTDPKGTQVASGYPGLSLSGSARPVQTFIDHPMRGEWKVSVYGAQVSMPEEPYYVLVASKDATASTGGGGGSAGSNDPGTLLFVGGLMTLLLAGLATASSRKRTSTVSPSSGRRLSGYELVGEHGVFRLPEGLSTIGRAGDNDLVLEGESVSRHHAVIEVGSSGVTVSDLNSTRGMRVNGAGVEYADVNDRDLLGVGDVELLLRRRTGGDGSDESE
jgi:hypothetical protein